MIKNGSWLASAGTAGGCRNYPTFVKNPQFIIDLEEDDDGDGKCSCLVAVMQKNRRKQRKMGVQDLCIGFSIYKVCTNAVSYHSTLSHSASFHFTSSPILYSIFTPHPPISHSTFHILLFHILHSLIPTSLPFDVL